MMRYNNIINGLLVIASITAFAACTEDTYDNSAAEGNGVFQFSGLPSIYTRAVSYTHLTLPTILRV